jgi:hypothetical protein
MTLLDPRVYNAFLEIAIEDEGKREAARVVWASLVELNDFLHTPMENPRSTEQREAKGKRAQDLAVTFVYNFSSAVGQELCTVHMHFGYYQASASQHQ